jgi:hypothetical protein
MKTLSFYILGLPCAITAILCCAGSEATQTETVSRRHDQGKSAVVTIKPENTPDARADLNDPQLFETIPREMQTDWSRAGLLPGTSGRRADVVVDVTKEPGATWDEKVESAVRKARNASGLTVLYFPAGIYPLSKSVVLSDASFSGIVFQGAGADSTVLEFTLGCDGNCFDVYGIESGSKLPLDADIEKGDRGFSASGLSDGFSKGEWVRLCEAGFPEADRENVGQTTRLTTVDGHRGVFEDEAAKTYLKSNELWIFKIAPVRNVGFENFTLRRMDQKEAAQDAYGRGINFKFNNAINFWIKGVASINTCRHHVVVNHSAHFEISGCAFAEACSRDENSYGYGVLMEVCTNNGLIQNNVFEHLRHSMTVCEGVNTNVLAFNYSRNQAWTYHGLPNLFQGADLCLHGRYPYANLFEQNVVEFAYADNSHGANGPYNVFLRNQVYHGFMGSGKIRLFRSPKTAVLGNMSTPEKATQVQYDKCEPFSDVFAFEKNGNGRHDHRGNRSRKLRTEDVRLSLVSFYYRSRPAFLDSAYTWPAIGPSPDGHPLTQSIPAKERCLSGMKTYLREPTKR